MKNIGSRKSKIWKIQDADDDDQLHSDLDGINSSHAHSDEREVKRPTTDGETLIHLLKGNIGAGMLALPEAFKYSGLYGGLIYTPILGVAAIHCMHLVVKCSRELCRRADKKSLNYEETAEMSFKHGPSSLQKYSKTVLNIISFFLILTQLGFCCVYFVFISQNMYQAVECITGGTTITQFDYMLISVLPILSICYIPDLKYLTPVSSVAFFLHIGGLFIVYYYLIRIFLNGGMKVIGFATVKQLPHYFGIVTYAFEGIGLVLPLENNMKTPESFVGKSGVLNTGMVIVTSLLVGTGFFGYLAYGDNVLGSITLNLPGDETLAQSVKILISLAMFLTYPLQFYVPLNILLPSVTKHFSSKKTKLLAEYAFRTSLVLLTFILAALIPNIGLFTNLIGAVCSSTLAFIFPPLIDTVTFWPDTGKHKWKLCKNLLIMSLGVLGFFTGAYTSIVEIIEFSKSEHHGIELDC